MQARIIAALWVPILAIALTGALIVGIGELLLAMAHAREEVLGIKEPYAVLVALLITVLALLGSALLARSRRQS